MDFFLIWSRLLFLKVQYANYHLNTDIIVDKNILGTIMNKQSFWHINLSILLVIGDS